MDGLGGEWAGWVGWFLVGDGWMVRGRNKVVFFFSPLMIDRSRYLPAACCAVCCCAGCCQSILALCCLVVVRCSWLFSVAFPLSPLGGVSGLPSLPAVQPCLGLVPDGLWERWRVFFFCVVLFCFAGGGEVDGRDGGGTERVVMDGVVVGEELSGAVAQGGVACTIQALSSSMSTSTSFWGGVWGACVWGGDGSWLRAYLPTYLPM